MSQTYKNIKEITDYVISNYDWFYYSKQCKWDSYEAIHKNPVAFIEEYIKIGSKTMDLSFLKTDEGLSKANHIISIYFLGLYVYAKNSTIKQKIDKWLSTAYNALLEKGVNCNMNFSFVWFMTCFYHDHKKDEETCNNQSDNDITKSLDEIFDNNKNPLFPSIFNKKLVLKYHNYRLNKCTVKDHGIYGGIAYWDKMKGSFEEVKSTGTMIGKDIYKDNKGRLWSKSILEIIHKNVAKSIIMHNIWFCKKDADSTDVEKYRRCGLSDLIIDSPLITTEHVFLFLLEFIDAIDIVKTADKNNLSHDDVKIMVDERKIYIDHNELYWLKLKSNINRTTIEI